MSPNEYQQKAMRTLCDQEMAEERLTDVDLKEPVCRIQLTHSIVGLAGEVGELASVLQKLVWYGKAMTPDELRLKIKDEMGDVLWYVVEGLSALGITLEETMDYNIAKLAVRYPDKYTDHLAADENRDRKAEAKAGQKYFGQDTLPPDSIDPATLSEYEVDNHGFGHRVSPEDCTHDFTRQYICVKCGYNLDRGE